MWLYIPVPLTYEISQYSLGRYKADPSRYDVICLGTNVLTACEFVGFRDWYEWRWRAFLFLLASDAVNCVRDKKGQTCFHIAKGKMASNWIPEPKTDHRAHLAWCITFHKSLTAKIHKFVLDPPLILKVGRRNAVLLSSSGFEQTIN